MDEARKAEGGLRLIPLGGLGEFGLNAMVLEWEGHRLLLDAGVLFPSAEMPGIDAIVPDFAYLKDRPESLHGVVLTHGHEDHIGALAFALKAARAPVYGSRLTLGFARRRLQERGMTAELHTLVPGTPAAVGPFRLHPIRVAHSVTDSLALAIETPAGVVLTSGDFKIDAHAPPAERTDLEALAAWGDRGVLALLSDSTNVEQRGSTGGEEDVLPAFREVLARTRGKVLVSCFATSIPRIQRVADLAREHEREVAFLGRRMVDNATTAIDLGLLRLPDSATTDPAGLSDRPAQKLLLFVSGSQGEPLSALSAISRDEHREVAVGPGDTVVLSARAIPGNERTVSRLIGTLFKRGCDVVHPGTAKVHVSGHGGQDDLLTLLRLVRPRYLVPIHGEYRMLAQHKRLAVAAGMDESRVLLAEDGDVLCFDSAGGRHAAATPAGRVLIDGPGDLCVEDAVIHDRRRLAHNGIVVPVLLIDRESGQMEKAPHIVSRGFVNQKSEADLLSDAEQMLLQEMEGRPREERRDLALTRERARLSLRRFFKERTERRPMVLPVVMEV
jgi:ribonuclease J